MEHKIIFTTICLLSSLAFNANAKEAVKEKPSYTLSAELGFLYKTGNTKSADIKAGLNYRYEKDQWLNLANFNILAKKTETTDADGNKNFESTDNKWNITTQSNYTINKESNNYLYGNLAYEQDKFSGFENQSSFSAGWGRQWFKTETESFFADIGPGVKHDVLRASEDSKTNFIIQAQALYTLQINEFVKLNQHLVAKQAIKSGENSAYKSITAITTKLIDSLQLKFSLIIDYDTEVEEGFENTNTETSMTLIYSF